MIKADDYNKAKKKLFEVADHISKELDKKYPFTLIVADIEYMGSCNLVSNICTDDIIDLLESVIKDLKDNKNTASV